jgi:ubiquinone/menaquinone biosynthesis C-methylase UbiE
MKLCPSCRIPFDSTDWTCPNCGARPEFIGGFACFAPELAQSNEGSPEGVHHYFDARQERSFWFRGRRRIIKSLAARYCPDAKSFLEVGCGPGFVLAGLREVLPEAKLVASEIYLHGLPYAAKRVTPPVEFVQADCLSLPYDREFDALGAFDVLEHVEQDANALAEMRRVLKPGGVILLTVPQHPWLWSRVDKIDHHKRRYRRNELADRLRDTGYSVLCNTSFMFFLLPAMFLQRVAADRRNDYYPDAEYDLPRPVDRIFEGLLDIERRAIALGVRFPAGGSRLVVARRD